MVIVGQSPAGGGEAGDSRPEGLGWESADGAQTSGGAREKARAGDASEGGRHCDGGAENRVVVVCMECRRWQGFQCSCPAQENRRLRLPAEPAALADLRAHHMSRH